MASLQVGAGRGVGCCFGPLDGRRQERRAVAAGAGAKVAEEDKVRLGESSVAVSKLGIGAWSWGDTTYWNDSEWDENLRARDSLCFYEGRTGQTSPRTGDGEMQERPPRIREARSGRYKGCDRCLVSQETSKYKRERDTTDRRLKEAKAAFDASIDNGMTFFDTAEVYGTALMGAVNSESLLGDFIRERQQKGPVEVTVATKFAALPWRFGRGSVLSALKKSLERLGLPSVELYQLHWPGLWGNEGYLDGLADAYEQGLVKAVGVSNYNEKRLRDAHARLKKRGVRLAVNQVNYSLIYRTPEENGVKAACDELGVTLIAYSPIAQGVLSGKYTPENPPTGPRGNAYTPEFLTKLQPLMNRIKEIGVSYGKNPTQVSLNWLTCQGNVVPIPGAKNAGQAMEFAGALGWSLTADEVEELRTLAREIKGIKMPIEES